jgi:hypothetical protein
MGEKGNMTSGELSGLLDVQAGAGALGAAGEATTVVASGGTTLVQTASGLGTKLVDKAIGVSGDEARDRIKEGREAKKQRSQLSDVDDDDSSESSGGSATPTAT